MWIDALERLTPLISALLWPIVLLVVFAGLRKPLLGLAGRLDRFRYGDVEAQFGSALERASKLAPEVLSIKRPDDVTPQLDGAEKIEELFALARASARGAIMDSWRELELSAVGAGFSRNRKVRGPLGRVSGIAAVEKMNEAGDVSVDVLKLYKELRALRNKANAAEFNLSESDARRYVLLTLQLATFFRRIDAEQQANLMQQR